MGAYILRRTLRMLVILVCASIAVFYALRYASGDPSGTQLNAAATQEMRAQYRHNLGLDRPIYQQYITYIGHLARGNFGHSLVTGSDMGKLCVSTARTA